jgi:hypothetical protein
MREEIGQIKNEQARQGEVQAHQGTLLAAIALKLGVEVTKDATPES